MFHIKSLRLGQPFLTKSASKRKIQQIYYKKGCPLFFHETVPKMENKKHSACEPSYNN